MSWARKKSTRDIYQHKWSVYRKWCHSRGHSVSSPSLSKIADFLIFLHKKKGLSPSCIKGYRSMLSVTFKFRLPEILSSLALKDLIRSFAISRPSHEISPPSWDLDKVLKLLRGPPF